MVVHVASVLRARNPDGRYLSSAVATDWVPGVSRPKLTPRKVALRCLGVYPTRLHRRWQNACSTAWEESSRRFAADCNWFRLCSLHSAASIRRNAGDGDRAPSAPHPCRSAGNPSVPRRLCVDRRRCAASHTPEPAPRRSAASDREHPPGSEGSLRAWRGRRKGPYEAWIDTPTPPARREEPPSPSSGARGGVLRKAFASG